MRPIVYAFDMGKAEGREAWRLILLGAAIAVAGLVLMFGYGLQALGLGFMAAAAVPALLGPALPYLRRAGGADGWLRLDGEGLTLGRRGLERHWRWRELSGLSRHGRLNPAALLRGRFLSLRASTAGASGSRRNVTIGDDYLTPIGEIAERLDDYFDQASAGAGRVRHGAAPERPAVFWDRKHKISGGVFTSGFLRGLILWGLGLGLVAFGVVSYVAGWPPDWSRLKEAFAEYTWVGSALFGVLLIPLAHLGRISAMGNFLLLSSDGLHLRRLGQRRHWRWRDLSDFEIRWQDPGLSADGHAKQVITFTARGDGTGTKSETNAHSQGFAIEDLYDAPLEEIARQLADWRRLERGAEAAPEPAGQGTEAAGPGAAPASLEMTEMTFRWGARAANSALIAAVSASLILVSTVELGAILWFFFVVWPDLAASSDKLVWLGGIAVVWSGLTIALVLPLIAMRPAWNSLHLDAEGFVYTRLGCRRRWSWQEISNVQLRPGQVKWGSKRVGLVTFAVPKDDRPSRFLRWAYGIKRLEPIVLIEDAYDTPADEIARRLNDYRRRAVPG